MIQATTLPCTKCGESVFVWDAPRLPPREGQPPPAWAEWAVAKSDQISSHCQYAQTSDHYGRVTPPRVSFNFDFIVAYADSLEPRDEASGLLLWDLLDQSTLDWLENVKAHGSVGPQ